MDELIQALEATGYAFAHFGWSKAPDGDYGVYAEDGANDLVAGDRHVERCVEGTVDYFTRAIDTRAAYAHDGEAYVTTDGVYSWTDRIPAKTAIENALNAARCAWYLNSIQFEADTGYVHLEWVFQTAG